MTAPKGRLLRSRHRLESGRVTQAGEALAYINRHQRSYFRDLVYTKWVVMTFNGNFWI